MSFLAELVDSTLHRVQEAKRNAPEGELQERVTRATSPRDLVGALSGPEVSLIAEIKRATPSQGPLDLDLDAAALARAYENGGAAAISVLTEPNYFKGSLEDMSAARSAVGVPVLRKDFLLDPYQVLEARAHGADAVLLIVRILDGRLGELLAASRALGMEALVEVFHEDELDVALAAGARVIGVNHRDLETFEVDSQRTAKIAPSIPEGVLLVAASGVSTRAEVDELGAAGAHAVLIGQSVVTAPDPAAKVRELAGP